MTRGMLLAEVHRALEFACGRDRALVIVREFEERLPHFESPQPYADGPDPAQCDLLDAQLRETPPRHFIVMPPGYTIRYEQDAEGARYYEHRVDRKGFWRP